MKPLFELPKLLSLTGAVLTADSAIRPTDSNGNGCEVGCSGGCNTGCYDGDSGPPGHCGAC